MLQDTFGRVVDYLRVSVTDRCDLRCIYCMPPTGVPLLKHSDILRFEEIEAIVRAGLALGIKNVRLTGGEPLTRPGITTLVQKLCAIPGLNELAMTTNGVLFSKMGRQLRDAGLKRVNFGVSSLNPDIYSKITRSGSLDDALEGLETAIELGFDPIKINVVLIRGINEDISDFVALAKARPVHVRFIEHMPIGAPGHSLVPAVKIRQRIEAIAETAEITELEPLEFPDGYGPMSSSAHNACLTASKAHLQASRGHDLQVNPDIERSAFSRLNRSNKNAWRVRAGLGSIAIIAPMTEHVCDRCNRLRLTADGHLRPCLFSVDEIDLKPALRPTLNNEMLKFLLIEAVEKKPKSLRESGDFGRRMSQIGG
ncbi:MAG: GTP 3',8-cyclase MoaA [Holophagales bacterium]|nr:GTP 3',8-cyclase MoaA [Holophagales bacterium]